jgi:hypothetical protein
MKKSSKITIVIFLFVILVGVTIGLYFKPTDWVCKTIPLPIPKCKGDKCSDCEGYNCTGGVSFKRDADGKCTIPTACNLKAKNAEGKTVGYSLFGGKCKMNDWCENNFKNKADGSCSTTECVNDFFYQDGTCFKIINPDSDNNIQLKMNEMIKFGSRRLMLTESGLQTYNGDTLANSATAKADDIFNFTSATGEMNFGTCHALPTHIFECNGTNVYELAGDNGPSWVRTRQYCDGQYQGHAGNMTGGSSGTNRITSTGEPNQC